MVFFVKCRNDRFFSPWGGVEVRGIEDVVYFWFVYGLIVMIGGNCLVPLLVDRLLVSKVVVISFSVKHATAQTVQVDVMFANTFGHCWCARILFGSWKRLLLVAQFKFLDNNDDDDNNKNPHKTGRCMEFLWNIYAGGSSGQYLMVDYPSFLSHL